MFFETHVRIAPQDLRGSCDRLVNLAALKDNSRMFLFFWLFDIGRFNFYALLISLLFPVLCRSYVSIWSIIFCTQRSIRGRGVNFSPPRINHATGQSRQLSRVVPKAWARFLKGNSEFVFPFFPSHVTDSNLSSTTRQRKVRVDGFYSTRETVANHFHTVNRTLPKSFDWWS